METLQLLNLLEKNARANTQDLAKILNESEEDVLAALNELERERVICGYHTVINWDRSNQEKVMAVIEVKAMPEREHGYDAVAAHIYKYPEVEACYLMSGNNEFMVIINGRTMQEVANFVGRKLAPIHGVTGTTTYFILKRYKVEGVILESEAEENERMLITP